MSRLQPNAQYNVARPDSLPVRIATYQRKAMYEVLLAEARITAGDEILDIGVTSDQTYASSNYLEAWYPHKSKIFAAGIDDASFLVDLYPGVRFVRADGLNLPFAGGSFDIVHASAVLEHVGSASNQMRFIAECARVSSKAFFLTTPNRWFPIEFHTVLPLVHWLPKTVFRTIMKHTGRSFFADEANLNLVSKSDLERLSASIPELERFDVTVKTVSLCGWPSNLLLIGRAIGSSANG